MASQIPKLMRAVDIRNGTGDASALVINDQTPVPLPNDSQALVKVHSFGLNRVDLQQREGQYPVPSGASETLGIEFSGTIVSLPDGPSVERGWSIGDEVFGLAYGGAYAEYVAVSTHMLIHKPEELSWEICAGIPVTWMTATQAVVLIGELRKGQSVLWHAGTSGLSIAGIQLAKSEGAGAIYVTASSQEKIDFCKELGATEGFNYRTTDWARELLKATNGKGVNLIVDLVGANYFNQNLDAIATDGRILSLGYLGGKVIREEIDISRFLKKRCRFEGSSLRSRDEEYQRTLRDQFVEHVLPKLKDGTFNVNVEKVFKMSEIRQAHELMETNQTKGKLICTVD